MLEHEQIFVMMNCKVCGKETDRWKKTYIIERSFVSHTNDPHKFICGNCGYTISLTDKGLKDAQLNIQEVL
jgi:transposase-like protein